jgi:protein SCO1/2
VTVTIVAKGSLRVSSARAWWRASVLLVVFSLVACGQPGLIGADLGARPSPEFALADQTGQTVRLADLRGKAVALTFLYSSCPDTCPLLTAKLRQVHAALGADAARVALVAVSVDPERDTVEQVARYTAAMGMEGRWHFLTGGRDQLGPVWAAYGIGVMPGPGGMIGHTDALFVIDRQGRQRVLMRSDLEPADLTANLRALLG